ncbi:hypothetical protein N9335_00720 [Crocinitomicaceae bacterium]|nr:hypothetical protein [Crocinitomicaceae bacterium]
MKYLILFTSILFFGCNLSEENNDNIKSKSTNNVTAKSEDMVSLDKIEVAKQFQFKNPDRLTEEDTLILELNDVNYQITPIGLFSINETDSIKLKTENGVKKAYIYEDRFNYYIFFEDLDLVYCSSYIEKISKKTMSSEYSELIYFNLGQPIILNEFAFVSAIGFVGKLNLKTGQFIWKHDDLYDNEKYSFNFFDTVIIKHETTEFISENYHSKSIDKIIIDNKSGEIKEIIK